MDAGRAPLKAPATHPPATFRDGGGGRQGGGFPHRGRDLYYRPDLGPGWRHTDRLRRGLLPRQVDHFLPVLPRPLFPVAPVWQRNRREDPERPAPPFLSTGSRAGQAYTSWTKTSMDSMSGVPGMFPFPACNHHRQQRGHVQRMEKPGAGGSQAVF